MTKEEYESGLAALKKEYEAKCNELARAYAMANNPYKVGDILQDHYQIIKVERIGWGHNLCGLPECWYRGTQLTKKLEPKKRQDLDPRMVQSKVKRKLN